jgi:hypothetical protein
MKTIPLTRGMVTVVDDEDYQFLSQWKWTAFNCGGAFYAARRPRVGRSQLMIYMHRVLAGATEGQRVDHKDRFTLNNQKHNLRFADACQNGANAKIRKANTSGFKGVSQRPNGKWKAQVGYHVKGRSLGNFLTREEAAAAYDRKAVELYGDYALTNAQLGLLPRN